MMAIITITVIVIVTMINLIAAVVIVIVIRVIITIIIEVVTWTSTAKVIKIATVIITTIKNNIQHINNMPPPNRMPQHTESDIVRIAGGQRHRGGRGVPSAAHDFAFGFEETAVVTPLFSLQH